MTELVMNPDNWKGFTPDPRETGEPEAVRWAQRDVMYSPDWSKWHATDGKASHTACGRVVVPFGVDDSPQFAALEQVDCKRCLAAIAAGRRYAHRHPRGSYLRRDSYPEAPKKDTNLGG